MKSAMPGTVKAMTPYSGAYNRPFEMSFALVGPS